jgi:hypothetical protein
MESLVRELCCDQRLMSQGKFASSLFIQVLDVESHFSVSEVDEMVS